MYVRMCVCVYVWVLVCGRVCVSVCIRTHTSFEPKKDEHMLIILSE